MSIFRHLYLTAGKQHMAPSHYVPSPLSSFDRALTDVFAVQDEITERIVFSVGRALRRDPRAADTAPPAPDPTSMKAVPRHLLILGGGPVGVEMAQAVRRLGGEVALVEGAEHVLAARASRPAAISALIRRLNAQVPMLSTSSRRFWPTVSVGPRECPGATNCPRGGECFAERARMLAGDHDARHGRHGRSSTQPDHPQRE